MRHVNPKEIAFRDRIKKALASEAKRSHPADPIVELRPGSGFFLQPAHDADERFSDPTADLRRLLAEGRYFDAPQPYRADPLLKRHYARRRPKPKWCWGNCQTFVFAVRGDAPVGGVTYCEGYVTVGVAGLLAHHAWVVVGEAVYDPTLEAELGLGGRVYFGIPYPPDDVRPTSIGRSLLNLPSLLI